MGERPGAQHCGEGSFHCKLFPHNFNYFPENICEHTHDVNAWVCVCGGGVTRPAVTDVGHLDFEPSLATCSRVTLSTSSNLSDPFSRKENGGSGYLFISLERLREVESSLL